jgi:adenosine kinase
MAQGKNQFTCSFLWLANDHSDAFAGGFTAGVVQGKSLEECVHMGQWLARLGLKELGPS